MFYIDGASPYIWLFDFVTNVRQFWFDLNNPSSIHQLDPCGTDVGTYVGPIRTCYLGTWTGVQPGFTQVHHGLPIYTYMGDRWVPYGHPISEYNNSSCMYVNIKPCGKWEAFYNMTYDQKDSLYFCATMGLSRVTASLELLMHHSCHYTIFNV